MQAEQGTAMELSTKKWIEDGQFMVEIKGSLSPEEHSLIEKYGDMRIDLSACKSRKSYSKLSDFLASGCFPIKRMPLPLLKTYRKN